MSASGQPSNRRVNVAAGLVFRDGQLLITQRKPDSHLGGLWEFPGGKLESGESFDEAVVRELREELGIEVRPGEVMESIAHDYPDKSVHLEFIRCTWLANEPQAHDCHDLAWITRGQLDDFEFPAADARLLGMLKADSFDWES
jgi:8-oxo-dGTP diphosphatase